MPPLTRCLEGTGGALMREGWLPWKFELPLGRRGWSFNQVPSPILARAPPQSEFQVGAEHQAGS